MLEGIIPVVFIPFDAQGEIDEPGLRRVVRFELDGGVDGIGVNGFASEAYKLTDDERRRAVEIVAGEVGGSAPLVIGIAPGSTEAAISQAREFAQWQPAALMTLPPATMKLAPEALVEHYVTLGNAADTPVMVQQSPHIQGYSGTALEPAALADIADRAPNVRYFKIEGPGAAARIAALRPLVDTQRITMFGGGGGITLPDELRAGSSGLIPGVGFNDYFCRVWPLWRSGKQDEALQATRADPATGHGGLRSWPRVLVARPQVSNEARRCDLQRLGAPPDRSSGSGPADRAGQHRRCA